VGKIASKLSIIEDNDQTRVRREHLEALRELVGNVYPNKYERSRATGSEDTVTAIIEKFRSHEPQPVEGQRPAPEALERANEELNKIEVRVSGRIATPPRVMGKAAFVHLSDGKERLQIYVRKADVRAINNTTGAPIEDEGAGWKVFNLLDHGDFIGVAGYLFVTKTGELSVHVRELQFLSKALLPMPDKLHGIADPEIRQRQRYADLIAGSLKVKTDDEGGEDKQELTTREVFEIRSKVITQMRHFLDEHGYIEVETPMLTPLATGAAARPFKTHHNALDIDLYARIAPELYLKRLLVGGFEKVYELNRNFRNEGIGYRWNPEFTMLEFYCAYMDVNGMMDFCEKLISMTLEKLGRGMRFRFGEHEIDFSQPFKRLTMKQTIEIYWNKNADLGQLEWNGETFHLNWLDDPDRVRVLAEFSLLFNDIDRGITVAAEALSQGVSKTLAEERAKAERMGKVFYLWDFAKFVYTDMSEPSFEAKAANTAKRIAQIFEIVAEHQLVQPTFITDFPKLISPLSKASPANPAIAERFELFVKGMEIANGFSELNDPVEQRVRFEEQMQQRERGDEEAMVLDEDYIRALSYGMPPAAGIGIGVDRFVMLLTNKHTIREVILFPHLRPERKAVDEAEESPEQEG
jgi:lysyl-tRNA synthetase class 2